MTDRLFLALTDCIKFLLPRLTSNITFKFVLMEIHGPWKTLNSKTVHDCPWIRVDVHDVKNPANKDGQYHTVHFKHIAVGVVPLDEDLNTYLVGQYRYPLKQYSWEICEGGGKLDVNPMESGKRELMEETGIEAKEWKEILTMHLSNSCSDEYGLVFVARDLTFHEPEPDEDEELELKKVPFDEFYQMVINGEITDSLSVGAALRLKIMIDNNEIQ